MEQLASILTEFLEEHHVRDRIGEGFAGGIRYYSLLKIGMRKTCTLHSHNSDHCRQRAFRYAQS
jgi:hypothetical protein